MRGRDVSVAAEAPITVAVGRQWGGGEKDTRPRERCGRTRTGHRRAGRMLVVARRLCDGSDKTYTSVLVFVACFECLLVFC
jgi:hypothetical protein